MSLPRAGILSLSLSALPAHITQRRQQNKLIAVGRVAQKKENEKRKEENQTNG